MTLMTFLSVSAYLLRFLVMTLSLLSIFMANNRFVSSSFLWTRNTSPNDPFPSNLW